VPWGIVSNPLPLIVVIAVEAGLMGAVEFYRRNGAGPAGYSPGVGKFESSGEAWCTWPAADRVRPSETV
jgi:light-harvesting complex II chlorophyll a/b binding protein 5